MANQSKTYGFSIYDIFTRVIPGLIIILSFIITPNLEMFSSSLNSASTAEILAVGVGAFLAGEVINLLRENWSPVPTTFRRILYQETDNGEFLNSLDKMRLWAGFEIPERRSIYKNTDRELYAEIKSEFNLPDNFDITTDLYTLVVNHVDGDMSSRTERFQMVYTFTENFTWAMIVFAIVIVYRGLVGDGVSIALTLVALVVQFAAMMIIGLIFDLYGRYEPMYVDSLITEFFVNQSK